MDSRLWHREGIDGKFDSALRPTDGHQREELCLLLPRSCRGDIELLQNAARKAADLVLVKWLLIAFRDFMSTFLG